MEEDFDEIEVIYSDGEENEDEIISADPIPPEDEFEAQVDDMSRLTFKGHTKPVFNGEFSKNMQLAITGGEDDMAYVWSTVDGKVEMECTGHKDSVTEVAFNYDNELVATGDMSGIVQVWNIKTKKLIWCYEGDDMDWLTWHPQANVLFTSHSGSVYIWRIPQGDCKVLANHGSKANSGKILPNGKQLLVGYEDGQIRLWDIKTSTMVWQLSEPFNHPEMGITQIDVNTEGTLLIAAPVSQVIKVADGKIVANLLVGDDKDIETVLFNSALNIIVTGSLNGRLCIWDSQRYVVRHQKNLGFAVTVMKCDGNQLFVGTVEGVITIYDLKSGQPLKELTGHQSAVLGLCLSEDKKCLLTTSDDATAKIFELTS